MLKLSKTKLSRANSMAGMKVDTVMPANPVNKQRTVSQLSLFKSKGGKCQRLGPVGRNPYLNFLREFRKRNTGLSPVETVRRGAQEWNALPKEQKLQYIEAAFYAPKKRRPRAAPRAPPAPPQKITTRVAVRPMDGCCRPVKCQKRRRKKKKSNSCGCRKKRAKRSSCRKKKRRRRFRC